MSKRCLSFGQCSSRQWVAWTGAEWSLLLQWPAGENTDAVSVGS